MTLTEYIAKISAMSDEEFLDMKNFDFENDAFEMVAAQQAKERGILELFDACAASAKANKAAADAKKAARAAEVAKKREAERKRNLGAYERVREAVTEGADLEFDEKGRLVNSPSNFVEILENDERFKGIRYNLLDNAIYWNERKFTDLDDAVLRTAIQKDYGIHNREMLIDARDIVSHARQFHPVREMIESIEWDGQSRIYTLLGKWLGCTDTEYTREVSRLIFAGGIHRIYNAGCKFDDVPVLVGKQGCGKSTFVRWLAMQDEFFAEVTNLDDQKGVEAINGKWICELGELLAMARAKEQEAIKSYLTRSVDHYRKPYERFVTDTPRQCIFLGTTNNFQFIGDLTGGRRFYPVEVLSTGYDLFDHKEEIMHDIAQCWAEAKALYDEGVLEPFANQALIPQIREKQENAQEDSWEEGKIRAYLAKLPEGSEICVLQCWDRALGGDSENGRTPKHSQSVMIGKILRKLGWKSTGGFFTTPIWGTQRGWIKGE